jgi:hypothetical protein
MSVFTKALEVIDMHLMSMTVEYMTRIRPDLMLHQAQRELFGHPLIQDTLDYLASLDDSVLRKNVSMATMQWIQDWKEFKEKNS